MASSPAPAPQNAAFGNHLFDDLGYGDVGFTGNQMIATPHMDKLAANGLVLEIITPRRRSVRRRAPPC